ncbi:unnamed protein product [Closterium sp. NIES-64]|nr:unnamed protein product [Closterium sp. NIES-64]
MFVGSPGSNGSGHSIRLGTNEDTSQHMPVLFPTYAQQQQQQQQSQPQERVVPDARRGAPQPAAPMRPAAQVKMRLGTNEDLSQYMPPIHRASAGPAAPQASPFGAADVASMLGARVDAMTVSPGGPPRRTSFEASPNASRDALAAVERSQSHDSRGIAAGPRGSAPMAGGSPRKDGLAPGMAGSPSYGARPFPERGVGFPSAAGSQGMRAAPYAARSAQTSSPPGAHVAAARGSGGGMGSGGGTGWGAGRQQQAPMPLPGRQASGGAGGASWDNMGVNMSMGSNAGLSSSWSDFDTRSIGSAGGSSARLTEGGGGAECRQFTLAQLAAATDNFSDANLLGRGAFGMVSPHCPSTPPPPPHCRLPPRIAPQRRPPPRNATSPPRIAASPPPALPPSPPHCPSTPPPLPLPTFSPIIPFRPYPLLPPSSSPSPRPARPSPPASVWDGKRRAERVAGRRSQPN